ncbi:MAG: thioredoxin domain-containing protein [Candidatus Lokiarchaeota archaeon]|nr:thioredoxin domain-containing protein [Candidatus Lokiarchaeota archaeon]
MQNKYNRLINEKSPYLLQHSQNPVDWYPWGEEAFSKAKNENKPIFLSIGYSTCHWCHVMAHECFEDNEIAKLMNDNFISIKVDREERPDIDNNYMLINQILTGSGGWPLTIIMTPEKKPFFSGTFFPKHSFYGRIGLIDLIPKIMMLWKNQKKDIDDSIESINQALENIQKNIKSDTSTIKVLKKAYNQIKNIFDEEYGGFGTIPKFPLPHHLIFLLRYWNRTGDDKAIEMVKKTLDKMRMGGIYDQIGYGFHRYSTDQKWHVPHFEKMLYDQALIALVYLEAFQATRDNSYAKVVDEIFTYLLRDMNFHNGAFYSAEDADSEGIEGKYYVWTKKEINNILNEEEAKLFIEIFNIKEEGNYLEESTHRKNKKNIPFLKYSISEIIDGLDIDLITLKNKLEDIRNILFLKRKTRIKPYRDDKILTDWNGLVVVALAKGGDILGKKEYIKEAEKTINFIFKNLYEPQGRLLHRFRENKAEINAFIDDYVFLIWGLLELYEATLNINYLVKAINLNKELISFFWDSENGGFYFTPKDLKDLIIRQKEIYDGAIPSGNSIAILNLMKLYLITGDKDLMNMIEKMDKLFSKKIQKNPIAYTQYLIGIDYVLGPSYSIVIAGKLENEDTNYIIESIKRKYIPNKSILLKNPMNNILKIDNIKYFNQINGKATAYICINNTCKPATNDLNVILSYLDSKWTLLKE